MSAKREPHRYMVSIIKSCVSVWILLCTFAVSAKELVIAINPVDGSQRNAFYQQVNVFKKAFPDLKVTIRAQEHEDYKMSIRSSLESGKAPADVLVWFGGASLRYFADKGWIRDLSELWRNENWSALFSTASRRAVTRSGKQFGLPLYYYQWGFYYRKSLFEQLNLSTPKTWEELLTTAQRLKEADIDPFTLGSQNHWPAAGWFDYINLRLNGLQFHQQLLHGCSSFIDKRVEQVFSHLRTLANAGFFVKDANQLDWKAALPYLYHKQAGMMLMGNFILPTIPDEDIRDDIGFFPFPEMEEGIGRYEEAPTDVLIAPASAKNPESADIFLRFMAQAKQQSSMAKAMGMISPNKQAAVPSDPRMQQGAALLESADGLSQFFDRDTHPDFTSRAMPIISSFVTEPKDIEYTLYRLEQARKSVWFDAAKPASRTCESPDQ